MNEQVAPGVSYRKYVSSMAKHMKRMPWYKLIYSKKAGKELARSLGVPTPEDYTQSMQPFVVKPLHGHSSKNVMVIDNLANFVVEELLFDEDGLSPPRDFRWYFFGDQCRMVHVSRPGSLPKLSGYYSWPDWTPLRIDTKRPWFECAKPSSVDEMFRYAKLLAAVFPIPIRVDFYATTRGPVFGEFCATPGLAVGKRITPEGDQMLGNWVSEVNAYPVSRALGDRDSPSS